MNPLAINFDECLTIVDVLCRRSFEQSEEKAFMFLEPGNNQESTLTYRELDQRSRQVAAQLQDLGLEGERALLLYPPGLDYLVAFFGCLYAGIIAIPAYPPRNKRNSPRVMAIVNDAKPRIILTTKNLLPKLPPLLTDTSEGEKMKWLATDSLKQGIESNWQTPKLEKNSLAFLQYTSGSTGTPKGVMVSHGNIIHNATMTYRYMEHTSRSKFVSWLPMYHDMGLIGGIIQPLYGGFTCVLMSPASFLQNPYYWLKTISEYQGTTSGGPNFAYELCLEKITPEQRKSLDLSSWTVAFNGSEPVRFSTLTRFAETFAECGFSPEAFYPCYGMAEATLMISGVNKKTLPSTKTIKKSALATNKIVDNDGENQDHQTFVSCGQSIPEQKCIIVDPDKLIPCQEDQVGEIWVLGTDKSIAQGYWQKPLETEKTFQAYLADTNEGPFLRTGDLGFLQGGEIYITGRVKDLIIIRGRNYYPQDLELTAERSHPALRTSSNSAFCLEIDKEEKLIIVQELEFRANPDRDEVINAIRQAVTQEHEVEVYGVVLIKPGTIPKTSSGKIQRRGTYLKFLDNQLEIVAQNILNSVDSLKPDYLNSQTLLALPDQESKRILESYLQNNLGKLLNLVSEEVNVTQPLNSLGLDSLKIFELKNKIEADFQVNILITDFFGDLNIKSLTYLIQEQIKQNKLSSLTIEKVPRTSDQFSLSFGQKRLWLIDRFNPKNINYNVPLIFTLKGQVNLQALKYSLNEIFRRHEILRTNYITREGEPFQIISNFSPLDLPIINLEHLNHPESILTTEKLIQEEGSQLFDLSCQPLIRSKLICLNQQEYKLLITLHHIAVDGWSIQLFLEELTSLYEAFINKQTSPFAELSIQYLDFSFWQRQKLKENEQILLKYWQEQLTGELPLLNLPTDFPRPLLSTFQGQRVDLILNATLTEALKRLSKQEGVTLFMTLLAIFKTLLYRYTSQTDIIVGSPIANRNCREIESLIGFFVNILVLRTNLEAQPTFRELLSRVRQVSLNAYLHQDFPFDKLVEELQPERDLNYNPLFQVMFVWENSYVYTKDLPNLSITCQEGYNNTSKVDLTMLVRETDQELLLTLEYDSNLFKPDTAQRILGHFSTLAAAIAINPDQTLADLPLLTKSEQQQILRDWNNTKVNYQQSECLHQLFEQQVEKTPESIALQFETQQLTYKELNEKANQLAHYLQNQGVKPEVVVGVLMERSPFLVIALLAILKAGGAYLPLDLDYPQDRLLFMLKDAQAKLILTEEKLLSRLPDSSTKFICVDQPWQNEIAQESEENPLSEVTGKNPAYIIYTSGSTGNPKGVINLHLGICNRLLWMQETYLLTTEDQVLQKTPFSFDVSVWEFFWPLLSGARLVLAKPLGHKDSNYLVRLIAQQQITVVHFVPSMLSLFLDHPDIQECNSLRQVICSGEPLTIGIQEKFFKRLEAKLDNLYGPTEAAIDVTFWRCRDDENLKTVPIGRPIANIETYILAQNLQPSPVGVPGELCIGGIGLARGYLNRPELTAEKFIKNPFSLDPEARLYKTGDLAKYHPDGNIEFLGRIDRQVKLRGKRLELGEIETRLLKHPGVKEALIILKEQHLVAYIILKVTEKPPTLEELQAYLQMWLPEYMIPSVFEFILAFPLLPNGKINHKALPVPEKLGSSLLTVYETPNSELEKAIADIWQQVLGREKVGINDNFFDLGGHSLLMIKVNYQIKESLKKEISIIEMFQHPTIKTLAKYLAQDSSATSLFSGSQDRVNQRITAQKLQKKLLSNRGQNPNQY